MSDQKLFDVPASHEMVPLLHEVEFRGEVVLRKVVTVDLNDYRDELIGLDAKAMAQRIEDIAWSRLEHEPIDCDFMDWCEVDDVESVTGSYRSPAAKSQMDEITERLRNPRWRPIGGKP